jgi:hypothetical protein
MRGKLEPFTLKPFYVSTGVKIGLSRSRRDKERLRTER